MACLKNIKTKWYKLQHTYNRKHCVIDFSTYTYDHFFFLFRNDLFLKKIYKDVFIYTVCVAVNDRENSSKNCPKFNPTGKLRVIATKLADFISLQIIKIEYNDKINSILEVFSKMYIWTYILLTSAYIENPPSRLSRRFDKPGGCIQFWLSLSLL